MRIAHIAPEMTPLAKAGGLGDVVGALPVAQVRQGHDVTVVLPGYRRVWPQLERTGGSWPISYGIGGVEVVGAAVPASYRGVRLLVIEHEEFFGRDGLYGDEHGSYADNGYRYGWFCGAALTALRQLEDPPETILAHDWPAALAPLLSRAHPLHNDPLADTGTVQVIHNLAHQGVFPMQLAHHLAIPEVFLDENGLEALGNVNFLKGGILNATAVATVSPTYAKEIIWPRLGEGLEGALQARGDDLVGVLNGLDVDAWNPLTDPHVEANYGPDAPAGKARCKESLQRELGLRVDPDLPLFGLVTRVDKQKGLGLVAEVAPWLVDQHAQVVLLGSGQRALLDPLHGLASIWRESVVIAERFDEALAHRIYAGCDFFLMPSLFEPCGLGQMVALRYGTPPIVRRTGGLADTVHDTREHPGEGDGFVFNYPDGAGLRWACERALAVFRDESAELAAIRDRGMRRDLSWDRSARVYERLLQRVKLREQGRILRI